jgi:4-diphosphocytidyl-2-C-methyl-D-erythritol kinase
LEDGSRRDLLGLALIIPAKINLWLEVVGKREDGYHELSSLMLPIGVFDRLELELAPEEGISLDCGYPELPADDTNLAWKAARLFLDTAGMSSGVHIRLGKGIPVGAGLGGGSADAAGALTGLNELAGRPLDAETLHSLARKLGADVAFFLYRRPALATGIGEKLQHVKGLPSYPLVLVKPPLHVSTRSVYQSLSLTRDGSHISIGRLLGRPWALEQVLINDLETVTISQVPVISEIKKWLLGHGAIGALMSGSGPTVFGVFGEPDVARAVAAKAREVWSDCWVTASETLAA